MDDDDFEGVTDEEERKLIEEMIAADQALTPDQRKAQHEARNYERFGERLQRLQKLHAAKAPALIISLGVIHLYELTECMWPQQMCSHANGELIERTRKRNGQCVICGEYLAMPYGGKENCAGCEANLDEMCAE